jgi:hypothetical protein
MQSKQKQKTNTYSQTKHLHTISVSVVRCCWIPTALDDPVNSFTSPQDVHGKLHTNFQVKSYSMCTSL